MNPQTLVGAYQYFMCFDRPVNFKSFERTTCAFFRDVLIYIWTIDLPDTWALGIDGSSYQKKQMLCEERRIDAE
jgi:hypothetical protein